jgi:hypothetical protein
MKTNEVTMNNASLYVLVNIAGSIGLATMLNIANAASKPPQVEVRTESKRIYQQTMADGSVLFTDVKSDGALKTSEIRYKSTAGTDALRVAAQQKEYWRRENEAFKQRQATARAEQDAQRRDYQQAFYYSQARQSDYGWSGPRVIVGSGFAPAPVYGHFPQQGQSGVGAAHNVPSSFIGSGFATSSPFAQSGGIRR